MNYLIRFLGFLLIYLTFSVGALAQVCGTGSIGVSGAGCGCLSGCDLSGVGGPNCGGGTSGNCSAGYTYMSITINIPAGCSVSASADMQNRSGCSASGADGGNPPTCSTGDRLRVVSSSNPSKPYQCGGANSTQTDTESLTGPGTITIEGFANRADEIIAYTVSYVSGGALCGASCGALPITLGDFRAKLNESGFVDLSWTTFSEINNDFFTIEKSKNGFSFQQLRQIKGAGNSTVPLNYYEVDDNPHEGISYYRLKQTDFDGKYSYSPIVAIDNNKTNSFGIKYSSYTNDELFIAMGSFSKGNIQLYDLNGKLLFDFFVENENDQNLIKKRVRLPKGFYLLKYTEESKEDVMKLVAY